MRIISEKEYQFALDTVANYEFQKKYSYCIPRFIKMENTCLRLENTNENFSYYRNAGHWKIDFRFLEDGTMISISNQVNMNNVKLEEATEEEWRKDNEGYLWSKL